MKTRLIKSLAFGAALIAGNAHADFSSGDYAIGNWSLIEYANVTGPTGTFADGAAGNMGSLLTGAVAGTGSVPASAGAANNEIQLRSANGPGSAHDNTALEITIIGAGSYELSFDWDFDTADSNAGWDPFGYSLNGTFTQLTAGNLGTFQGAREQDGLTINGENVVLNVTAGDVFSFVIQSADSDFGSSAVTISEFSVTPVPLPPSMGLFGFALGGMMMMQRRRAAQEKSQH